MYTPRGMYSAGLGPPPIRWLGARPLQALPPAAAPATHSCQRHSPGGIEGKSTQHDGGDARVEGTTQDDAHGWGQGEGWGGVRGAQGAHGPPPASAPHVGRACAAPLPPCQAHTLHTCQLHSGGHKGEDNGAEDHGHAARAALQHARQRACMRKGRRRRRWAGGTPAGGMHAGRQDSTSRLQVANSACLPGLRSSAATRPSSSSFSSSHLCVGSGETAGPDPAHEPGCKTPRAAPRPAAAGAAIRGRPSSAPAPQRVQQQQRRSCALAALAAAQGCLSLLAACHGRHASTATCLRHRGKHGTLHLPGHATRGAAGAKQQQRGRGSLEGGGSGAGGQRVDGALEAKRGGQAGGLGAAPHVGRRRRVRRVEVLPVCTPSARSPCCSMP